MTAAIVVALWSVGTPIAGVARPAREPCDGPGASTWASDFRDRMLAYDGLARFALETYGDPVTCDGEVTAEFDGALFGSLRLTFATGITLEAHTQPPESSVTLLRSASGFADAGALREMLRAHAADVGLRIAWSAAPEVAAEDGERVERYRDPEPGLNAAALLVFRGDDLVAVGLSLAL